MITHIIESYWIPSEKKTKSKLKNLKNSPKFVIFEFWNKHLTQHIFWSCLMRWANMKWIVEDTERPRFCPQTDRRIRWNQHTLLSTLLKRWYNWTIPVLVSYSTIDTYVNIPVCPWWRHEMETISTLLAICVKNSPVPGESPAQRPVTWSFAAFFDLRLNKRLRKQMWGWWFETPSRPSWRHRNATHETHCNKVPSSLF